VSADAGLDIAGDAIAIIGIGCRYPGVHGPRAFWELVQRAHVSGQKLPDEATAWFSA